MTHASSAHAVPTPTHYILALRRGALREHRSVRCTKVPSIPSPVQVQKVNFVQPLACVSSFLESPGLGDGKNVPPHCGVTQ